MTKRDSFLTATLLGLLSLMQAALPLFRRRAPGACPCAPCSAASAQTAILTPRICPRQRRLQSGQPPPLAPLIVLTAKAIGHRSLGLLASPPHTMPRTDRARDIPRSATTRIGAYLSLFEYHTPHKGVVTVFLLGRALRRESGLSD